MLAVDVWEGRTPGARALRAILTPLSWLYAMGWRVYLGIYDLGLKRAAEPHRPVLCIGNLVAGGSGKTPVAIHVARVLLDAGREVVVGCSGYGGPREDGATLASDGPLLASEWGDEPALLRECLPEVPLIVGRARVRAAELCASRHPGAVLLMDDGFQHLPLRKHLAIVLAPRGANGRCLPAGPLREPVASLKRADLVLPGEFSVATEPLEGWDPRGGSIPLEGEMSALCAIGDPQRFFDALRAVGVRPEPCVALGDHDPLTEGNLLSRVPGDRPVAVTAKDWVKLRERPDAGQRRWVVVRHAVRVEPAEAFRTWLLDSLRHVESQGA